MENIIAQYVTGELILLVVCLNILGVCAKRYKYLADKYIPLVLFPLSVVLTFGIKGISYTNFLVAILCWGVSIGVHQTVKQMKK